MTKEELQDRMVDDFHTEFMSSELSSFLENYDMIGMGMGNAGRGQLEECIYSFIDALAERAIETLEETGVMRSKKETPV